MLGWLGLLPEGSAGVGWCFRGWLWFAGLVLPGGGVDFARGLGFVAGRGSIDRDQGVERICTNVYGVAQ